MSKLQKVAAGVSSLGALGTIIAGLFEFGDDGRVQKFKIGGLAVWDRRRMEARQAARAARRSKK